MQFPSPSHRSGSLRRPATLRVAALCAVCLPLWSACQKEKEASPGEGPKSFQQEVKRTNLVRVQVAPAERREMVRTLSVTRALESEQELDIMPRTQGIVTELLVDEGDRVAKDQVLARLDAREAEAALSDARLALEEARGNGPRLSLAIREAEERMRRAKLTHEQAQRDYERNKSAGFVSSADLEQMELTRDQAYQDWQAAIVAHESAKQELENQAAVIDRAELAVEKAQLELSFFEIKAPFGGVIAERQVQLGASVGSTASAFKLTNPDRLKAVLYRPQKELAFFQAAADHPEEADLEIVARPEAFPDHEYTGRIRRVSPTVDAESGSIRVTIDLVQPTADEGRPLLLAGMMVRLQIVTERRPEALVVQKRALRREGDRRFLFAVRDGAAARIEVEEGLLSELDVEVTPLEGYELEPGEPVVVVGGRDLEDGQAVRVSEESAASEAFGPDELTAEDASDAPQGSESSTDEEPQQANGDDASSDDA